jgi:hypothetical protein
MQDYVWRRRQEKCNSIYCVIFFQQIYYKRVYIRMQAELRAIQQGIKDLSRSETATAVLWYVTV